MSNDARNLILQIDKAQKELRQIQDECEHSPKFYKYADAGGKIFCPKCKKIIDVCLNPKRWDAFLKKHNIDKIAF